MSSDKPFHVCPHQTQEQVEQGYSASLLGENQVSGVEVKADHEVDNSAAPVPNADKWSSDAVVARSNARPKRMEKLKMAGILGVRIANCEFGKSELEMTVLVY